FRNPVQLINETNNVRHMFDNMSANDFVKLIVAKWIGKNTEIVYHVRVGPGISVDANRAWILVLTTADIENLFVAG
ncbi:MAG TPA: hypothetical protein VF074_20410, partial [Pyrinomonadaceae bacterium]